MYKAKYTEKKQRNSKGELMEKSQLVAKFRFRKEVAPKDRKDVRERIKGQTDMWHQSPSLTGSGFHSFTNRGDYWRYFLNFEISVSAKYKLTKDELPNLEEINNYILTGKRS